MARVRQEAARVGQHADEARQQAHVRQRVHLLAPCRRADRGTTRRCRTASCPGAEPSWKMPMIVGEQLVVARVQVVDDRLGELSRRVEPIEEAHQRARPAGSRRSRRSRCSGPSARIPRVLLLRMRAEVELLHPAARVIHHGEVVEQRRAQLLDLVGRRAPARRAPWRRSPPPRARCTAARRAARGRGPTRGSRPRGRRRGASAARRAARRASRSVMSRRRQLVDPAVPAGEVVHAPAPCRAARSGRAWCAPARSSRGAGAARDRRSDRRCCRRPSRRTARSSPCAVNSVLGRAGGCSARRSPSPCRARAACPRTPNGNASSRCVQW